MSIGAGGDLPPLVALVQADVADFLAKVQVVSGQLDSLSSKDTQTTIGANIADFESKMAAVNETLATWGRAEGVAEAGLSIDAALVNFALINAELDKWGARDVTATVDLDTAPALAKLAALDSIDKELLFGLPALTGDLARLAPGGGGGSGTTGLLSRLLWGGGSGGIYGFGAGLAGFGSLGSLAGFGPEHLATVGLGLAGSATGGLIGGGLLAAGSLGTAAVGAGTDLAGIGQAVGDTKSTLTNLNALSAAQQEYGKDSAQAAAAQSTLNQQLQGFNQIAVGAVVQTAETAQGWVKMFDAATGAAEKTGAEILTQAMKVGEEFLPTIGKFAAENTSIIQKDIQPLFAWMGGQGLQIFTDLENKFQGELPTSLNALTQGIELFARTIDLASQSTGGLMQHLSDFLTRMNGADFDTWSAKVEKLIGDFRLWDDFVKILFKDIADLFSKDVGTASGIVTTLTNALNSLHEWINSTTGSADLATIFEVHKEQILALLPVVGQLLDTYGKLFFTVAPYAVTIMTDLIKTFGDFLSLIEKLGPLADYAVALTLIAGKLGVLPSLFRAAFGTNVFGNLITDANAAVTRIGLVGSASTEAAAEVETIGTAAETAETEAAASISGIQLAVGGLVALAAVPIVFTVVFKETLSLLGSQSNQNANFNAALGADQRLAPDTLNYIQSQGGAANTISNLQNRIAAAHAAASSTGDKGTVWGPGDLPTSLSGVLQKVSGTGVPSGNATAPSGPTTASQAAQAAATQAQTALVTQGQSVLAQVTKDEVSKNLSEMTSAVKQVHSAGFAALISDLGQIHTSAAATLTKNLISVEDNAEKLRTAESKSIAQAEAAARIASTVTANNTMTADISAAATDVANAAAQLASDASKLITDTASGTAGGISDQASVLTDQGNAQIQAIQDQSQILTDQMAESGLTGDALLAAQAQVQLDIQKQTDDAKINADTIALAQQKAADDAKVSAQQIIVDQTAQHEDQLVAAARANQDAIQIRDQSRVNAATIAYAIAEASQNTKLQTEWLSKLNAATQDQSTDNQNAQNATNAALNNQTSANAAANNLLASIQSANQVIEAILAAQLAGDTTTAGIQEAKLAAIVQQLNESASIQSAALSAASSTTATGAPIQVTVVTQIDGQQVALTTTPLIRQELLRTTARQTQNIYGGSAGRLVPA